MLLVRNYICEAIRKVIRVLINQQLNFIRYCNGVFIVKFWYVRSYPSLIIIILGYLSSLNASRHDHILQFSRFCPRTS